MDYNKNLNTLTLSLLLSLSLSFFPNPKIPCTSFPSLFFTSSPPTAAETQTVLIKIIPVWSERIKTPTECREVTCVQIQRHDERFLTQTWPLVSQDFLDSCFSLSTESLHLCRWASSASWIFITLFVYPHDWLKRDVVSRYQTESNKGVLVMYSALRKFIVRLLIPFYVTYFILYMIIFGYISCISNTSLCSYSACKKSAILC